MKQARRMLSILLTLALLLGTLAAGFSVFAAGTGSVVRFGCYPQSEVTDAKLINKLSEVQKHWKSFGYYSGSGSWDDGRMAAADYATYADFTYDGSAYRAIFFTKYRQKQTGAVASTTSGGYGYSTDLIYYFKYEPIEWIVLDASAGLLMSKKVLDSQAYQNFVRKSGSTFSNAKGKDAKDFATSSLNDFLNGSFFNTAFTQGQKEKIKSTAYDCTPYGASTAASVTKKVTVLSYSDCMNTQYGFSASINDDTSRIDAEATTYAMAQGLSVSNGRAVWWLRTPDSSSGRASWVETNGALSHTATVNMTDKGVRPVITVTAVQEDVENAMVNCKHENGTENFPKVEATCVTPGHEAYSICKDCSAVVTGSNQVIPAAGHVDKVMRSGEPGADGWCDVCGEELHVHLDNSGSLQLDGPMKGILDLIRKLVQKLEGLFSKLSPKDDGKKDEGTATETTQQPADTSSEVDLSETGKTLDSFADMLGTIINAFKGISDKKSSEKEQDRSDFLEFLTNYAHDDSGE